MSSTLIKDGDDWVHVGYKRRPVSDEWPTIDMPVAGIPAWTSQGVCAGMDVDFSAVGGGTGDYWGHAPAVPVRTVRRMKAACDVCPVKNECLEWALEFEAGYGHGGRGGLFGGMTPSERDAEHRRRKHGRRHS